MQTLNKTQRLNHHFNTSVKIPRRNKSKEELDAEYIDHCISLSKEKKFKHSKEKDRNQMLKRCQHCLDFINENYMVFCMYCQDAYHSYCISPPLKFLPINRECISCIKCQEVKNKNNLKQLTLKDMFTNTTNSNSKIKKSNSKKCEGCKQQIKEELNNLSKCEKCKREFHKSCFRRDENKIVCSECENKINCVLKATKISDYFKSEKLLSKKRKKEEKEEKHIIINSKVKNDFNIFEKISREISQPKTSKDEGHIKLPKKLNRSQKDIMMKSLFRALKVKDINFNDDLVFLDSDCPSDMNNAFLEPGITEMSDYNKQKYKEFKERSRIGEYAPVEVIDDPIQRFIVRAIDDIQMNTIICEYTGEVSLLRKTIFDKNDSIMELIRTPSADTSLVIHPEEYGNLARFLSGVNNYDEKLRKKQNVYSIKVGVDGKVHILLLAMRNIKKGEILYYDYNAGGYNQYPTEHFV